MGAGEWQGQFYGPDADDTDAPGTAAGTFNGVEPGSAYVSGAFGAHGCRMSADVVKVSFYDALALAG